MPHNYEPYKPVVLTGGDIRSELRLIELLGDDIIIFYLEKYFTDLDFGFKVLSQLSSDDTLYGRISEFIKNLDWEYHKPIAIAMLAALEGANYHNEMNKLMIELAEHNDRIFEGHWVTILADYRRERTSRLYSWIEVKRRTVSEHPIIMSKFHRAFIKLIR